MSPYEEVHIQAPLAMMLDGLSDWTALRGSVLTLPLECVGANKLIAIAELLLQALFFQGHQKEHALLLKHKPRLPDRGFEGQPKHAGICSREYDRPTSNCSVWSPRPSGTST